MFVHKIDEELELRLIETGDADRIFELTDRHRTYLRTWLPWVDNTERKEDTKSAIRNFLHGYAENQSVTVVILFRKTIVGMASFNKLDWTNRIAYIGYWLSEDYQGNGIVTKTVTTLTTYAFSTMGMNKVDIRAAAENKSSRAIPERLGFVQEGVLRDQEWVNDRYVDHVVYGMLRKEWKN